MVGYDEAEDRVARSGDTQLTAITDRDEMMNRVYVQ